MIRFTRVIILVLCLGHGMALAQPDAEDRSASDLPEHVDLFPFSFAQINELRSNFALPVKKNFFLEFGSNFVEVKGFYLEKRQELGMQADGSPGPAPWGSYFNLLVSSAAFGGKLAAESEFAYSALGRPTLSEQRPIMSRFALKGTWARANYGVQYHSLGSGYVSTSGLKVDHQRDQRQLWGEYDFTFFKLRGNLDESMVKNTQTREQTLTRAATTILNFSKADWGTSLSSSYTFDRYGAEITKPGPALINALSMVYRPNRYVSIEPALSYKQEWDAVAGCKTDTPSWGLALISTPDRDFQFSTRASYSRALSDDPLKEISTITAATALNWRLFKTFVGDQSLSLQLEYKNETVPNALTKPQPNVSALLNWKIAHF